MLKFYSKIQVSFYPGTDTQNLNKLIILPDIYSLYDLQSGPVSTLEITFIF
ncbi:hypothetical protein I79_006526 [Cricetulus griseus]|uniref:Uncharacterized protein n=1 Tax=Cricetulus griseus TaxID=10029 RepID=G3H831_CRIGR|nr:hypothetical protein I79_006526 [Cricetulus griseus]